MSEWRVRGTLRVKRPLAWHRTIVAIVGLGVAVSAASSSEPGTPAQQIETIDLINNNDPLTKFAQLMPVVGHPRCVNCHGGSNPFDGINHPPNVMLPEVATRLRDANGDHDFIAQGHDVCDSCHDIHPTAWVLAHRFSAFKDRTARQICRLWKNAEIGESKKVDSAQALLTHLDTDELIAIAFEGNKNVDEFDNMPVKVDKPPQEFDEFFQKAKDWLKDGTDIPCAGWEGTITQTETVNSIAKSNTAGGDFSEAREDTQIATRTVKVIVDGGVKVEISVQAKQTVGLTIVSPDCSTTSLNVVDVHPKGAKTTVGEAQNAQILFTQGGKYHISIRGPDEVNERVERSDVSLCGLMPFPGESTAADLSHDGWVIGMDGVLPDPSDRTQLKGGTPPGKPEIRTERAAWLTGSGGVLAPFQVQGNGGQTVPVQVSVTTEWDLRRLK